MKLSIVIVSWNVRDKLKENLTTLLKSKVDFEFEVFVVDNNSEDGTDDMVKKDFPQVHLIDNPANFGFAKANNHVLKEIETEFALLLNPDMQVFPDTLQNMVDWMEENQQASLAGCHLLDDDNETIKQVRRFPRLKDQLAIVLKLPHLLKGVLDDYILADFDYSKPAKVDSVRGGFFMMNLQKIKDLPHNMLSTLPLLDDRYFLWFEEVDYCLQIKKAGGEVWYTPTAKCRDHVGQSFKQLPRGQSQKYMRDSMLKYFKKWHKPYEYFILKLAWPVGILMARAGEMVGVKGPGKT